MVTVGGETKKPGCGSSSRSRGGILRRIRKLVTHHAARLDLSVIDISSPESGRHGRAMGTGMPSNSQSQVRGENHDLPRHFCDSEIAASPVHQALRYCCKPCNSAIVIVIGAISGPKITGKPGVAAFPAGRNGAGSTFFVRSHPAQRASRFWHSRDRAFSSRIWVRRRTDAVPCRSALLAQIALPASVRGPVERSQGFQRRIASACFARCLASSVVPCLPSLIAAHAEERDSSG